MSQPPDDKDQRLDRVVELVVELAAGNLSARLTPSPAADSVDAVIVGINLLAEELQALYVELEDRVAERTGLLEQARHQLERLALHDGLTGLANRTLLGDRVEQAMTRAERGESPPAILLLDLDGFKTVNDSFGHAVGDLVLIEVARRLRAVARDTDTVARLGGDEFALVILDAAPERVLEVAERARTAVRYPIEVGDHVCWVGASIGVCFAVRGQSADALLRDADTAMYAAKAQGRDSVQVFEPAMHAAALSRVQLAEELRAALAEGQLRLHYQPVVELATRRTTGVEALVRWQHPTRGLLAPAEFISVAEDTGLITDLGQWVLDNAVEQLARWQRTVLRDADFRLNVNASAMQFRSGGFADAVLACLDRHGVRPRDLLLEITETAMLAGDAQSVQTIDALRAAGVGLAIDDFGTGYSSIDHVRQLLIDVVKVDRSLVTGMDTDAQQFRVAAAIVALVDAFGLAVVAEGVETATQAEMLQALGCRYGQGFHFGAPIPGEQMTAALCTQVH